MKLIIFLTSLLVSLSIFSATHKIAIDARDYSVGEIDITREIVASTKTILDADTADTMGGAEWDLQVTESGSLATSVEAANNFQAEKLIQICMNSFNETANGTETYARTANTTENDLATKVQSNVVSFLGLNDRGVKDYAGDATANMEVVKLYPGFMDNINDYNTMVSEVGRKNIAKGILFGLQEHFGLVAYDPNEIHDTEAPIVTINSHINNQVVNTPTITITGTATDNIAVTLLKVNNVEVNLAGDNFSKEITLTEGINNINVYSEDGAGNNSTKSVSVNYVVLDTTPPTILVVYPTNNATVALQNIDIRGKVTDDDSGVKYLKIDGATVSIDGAGVFTYPVVLSQGTNTFQLKAEDNDGNIREQDLKVVYEETATDTTPPTISVVTPTNNQIVNVDKISVKGSIEDDSPISAFTINGRNVDLVNNAFDFEITLSQGTNEIKLYVRDSFNNQNTKNINVIYNPDATDTTPPVIAVTSPANNAALSNANVSILGTVTDNNEVVSFTINSNIVPLTNTGDFNYNTTLVVGENKFELKSKDDSNNESSKTLILYLESHQNSGPEIIVTTPKDGDLLFTDNVDIKGTVRDSDGVKYLSINNYKVDVDSENKFSFNLPLSEGINDIVLKASDNIDNKSELTLNVRYDVKESKPDNSDGCDFDKNSNKNFTNTVIFLMIGFILYFRRKWIIRNNK